VYPREIDKLCESVRFKDVVYYQYLQTFNLKLNPNDVLLLAACLRSVSNSSEVGNTRCMQLVLGGHGLGLDRSSFKALTDSLKVNKSLLRIVLSSNSVNDYGADQIAGALKTNTSLTSLVLSKNQITDIGCSSLAEVLQVSNRTLLSLDLSQNRISNSGAKEFIRCMQDDKTYNSVLTQIRFSGNEDISESVLIRIENLLEANSYRLQQDVLELIQDKDTKGRWNRCKLMVVGNGRAGKTATVRSLLGQKFIPEWNSTIGVNLSHSVTRQNGTWLNVGAVGTGSLISTPKKSFDFTSSFATNLYMREQSTVGGNTSKSVSSLTQKLPVLDDLDADEPKDKHKDFTDMIYSYNEQLLLDGVQGKDSLCFNIWDYAGQSVFYDLHHLFLTNLGIYLLVFNMSNFSTANLQMWLDVIYTHAKDAPVMVIGTFLDEVDDLSKVQVDIRNLVSRYLPELNVIQNGQDGIPFFTLNNVNGDGIDSIRKHIEEEARSLDFINKLVPLRWMKCLDEMMESAYRTDDVDKDPWIPLVDVKSVGKSYGILSSSEVEEMLSFLNELGMIIYLTASEMLKQLVIVDCQWLIDAISLIIRDEKLHQRVNPIDVKNGIIDRDLLENVWREYRVDTDFLIDFMRQALLLSEWKFGTAEKMYLIPSLLNEENEQSSASSKDKYVCDFVASGASTLGGNLPLGIFGRLVCLCVAYSNRYSDSMQPKISRSWGEIWFGADCFNLKRSQAKISLSLISSDFAPRCLAIILSMLEKISVDFLHGEVFSCWNVFLKESDIDIHDREDSILDYENAKKKKISPWFDSQSNKNNSVETDTDVVNMSNTFLN